MEFDKSKIYTSVNADELKAGDKVYVSDNLYDLECDVKNDENLAIIQKIYAYDCDKRFMVKFCCNENPNCYDEYCLAYLVERAAEKWRPFKDINELEGAWVRKTNIPTVANTMPLIWVKRKNDSGIKSITSFRFSNNVIIGGCFYTMEELFESYEFLDGTPCGVKE